MGAIKMLKMLKIQIIQKNVQFLPYSRAVSNTNKKLAMRSTFGRSLARFHMYSGNQR